MSVTYSISGTDNDWVKVEVECHITNGLPSLIIIGQISRSIDESRERIRAALTKSDLQLPRKRITINLAPAEISKDGTAHDLPIAIAILVAAGMIKAPKPKQLFIGELGLDGSVKPIRGIIGMLLGGKALGFKHFIIPSSNLKQALMVPGITVSCVNTLREVYLYLNMMQKVEEHNTEDSTILELEPDNHPGAIDFAEVVGQIRAKRAMEIAAAGGHNILLSGPPGAGKSMMAKALPGILPSMNTQEALEVTHLHSLATRNYDRIILRRPFRSPHHTSSHTSIIGGGQNPRPGEISLSHNGVLMLDEFPEYSRSTLESLRQPLEDKIVSIARSKGTVQFPANFMLVATCNPCPCGFYGSNKACACTPYQIDKYMKKLSGPIIDRIDLYVEVDAVQHTSLLTDNQAESSEAIRQRVIRARASQKQRYRREIYTNSLLSNKEIKKYAQLQDEARNLLDTASAKLELSARSYMRTIKVARTIADLDDEQEILTSHVSEALQYRKKSVV